MLVMSIQVVGAVQPRYDSMAQAISDLGSPGAEWASVMNSAFVITGALMIFFGCAFPLELGSTPSAVISAVSWGTAGLSLAGVGIVPFPHPHHVEISVYGALFACIGVISGHLAVYTVLRAPLLWLVSPIAASSTFLFFFIPLGPWGRQGLWERGFLFCVAAWQVLAAAHLLGYERFRSNIALQQTAGAGAHARGERPRSPAAAERGRWT